MIMNEKYYKKHSQSCFGFMHVREKVLDTCCFYLMNEWKNKLIHTRIDLSFLGWLGNAQPKDMNCAITRPGTITLQI